MLPLPQIMKTISLLKTLSAAKMAPNRRTAPLPADNDEKRVQNQEKNRQLAQMGRNATFGLGENGETLQTPPTAPGITQLGRRFR